MIFGKHINRYYLRYGWLLLLGLAALVLVDVLQLEIPKYYRMVIDGMTYGTVDLGGTTVPFNLPFLLDEICDRQVIMTSCEPGIASACNIVLVKNGTYEKKVD